MADESYRGRFNAIPDGAVLEIQPSQAAFEIGGKFFAPGVGAICDRVNGEWVPREPVTVRFNMNGPTPVRIVEAKPGDPEPQPVYNTAVEALVEIMSPGVGESDTLGAPYAYDRALLRDFAERLIRAGVIRGEAG